MEVSGFTSSMAHGLDIEDFASVILRGSEGAVVSIDVGYTFPTERGRYVSYCGFGANGSFAVNGSGMTQKIQDSVLTSTAVEVNSNQYYGIFADRIARSLESGFLDLPQLIDLEKSVQVVEEVYRQTNAYGGRLPQAVIVP